MKLAHRLLILQFLIGCVIGVSIKCLALDVFIKTVGAGYLGSFYAYAAILAIVIIIANIYISKIVQPVVNFIVVHFIQMAVACACLVLDLPSLEAKVLFLVVFGYGVNVVFSSWSMTNAYITPFESKRLFPRIGIASQIGFFLGAIFAMASQIGIRESHYLVVWVGLEGVALFLGFVLFSQSRSHKKKSLHLAPVKAGAWSLLNVLKHYKLVPHLTLWVFVWGIIDTFIDALTGANFDRSGTNLTLLYGILSLSGAVAGIITSTFIYSRMVKRFGLGTVLLVVSIMVFIVGSVYLKFDVFILAIAAVVTMSLLDKSFLGTAISMEIGLYPAGQRDRIRLIGQSLAISVGSTVVGPMLELPPLLIPWIIWGLLVVLVIAGYLVKKYYHTELLEFLGSKSQEERDNAIALFDQPNDSPSYNKILQILTQGGDLPARINVLNTFTSLGSIKPAPLVVKMLMNEIEDPLRVAILRYFMNIRIKSLDPFVTHQLFESLKQISKAHVSNNLRAMAVKIWVQNAPVNETVGFILERLRDTDERVIANAIEGLNNVKYAGALELLLPYLKNPVPRIRANTIVATWQYDEVKTQVREALDEMIGSGDAGLVMSGLWAAGEVGDKNKVDHVRKKINHADAGVVRNALITLLKLDHDEYADKVRDVIVGPDEGQAINMCYLVLRISERILNEKIIAGIFDMGEEKCKLAIHRFSRCGGFCRDQLILLSGERLYNNYA